MSAFCLDIYGKFDKNNNSEMCPFTGALNHLTFKSVFMYNVVCVHPYNTWCMKTT